MIALTIDCEEWNSPRLRGKEVSENDNTLFSRNGNNALLKLLDKYDVQSTFFITGYFADREKDNVKKIGSLGHEIASHGYIHHYRNNDLDIKKDIQLSLKSLNAISREKVIGFRSPQVQYSLGLLEILGDLGFKYDSSLHPAVMPGFYNHSNMPTVPFRPLDGKPILELPCSVSTLTRLPISWLFIRLFGISRTIHICKKLIRKNITPIIYLHSWEFTKMSSKNVPFYFNYRTGRSLLRATEKFLNSFKSEQFIKLKQLLNN